MNSDLKAQLRELNITAAKVGWTFSTRNWVVTSSVYVSFLWVLVYWVNGV